MKNNKKMIGVVVLAVVCVIVLFIALFPSLQQNRNIGDFLLSENMKYDEERETLAASASYPTSSHEAGVFFFFGGTMQYYDCEKEERYVLCSDPGCDHMDGDCNAYIGDKRLYGGYAMHQGRIYVMYAERDQSELKLFSVDPAGRDKKEVVSFDAGSGKMKESMVTRVGDTYYDHGYAYVHLYYNYVDEDDTEVGEKLVAIRLSDGRVTELTDIIVTGERYTKCEYELITEDTVIYTLRGYDPIPVSYEEYEKDHPGVEYAEYYEDVYNMAPESKWYYEFHPKTNETELAYEEKLKINKDVITGYEFYASSYFILGHYDGKWLISVKTGKSIFGKGEYRLYDPVTKSSEIVVKTSSMEEGAMGMDYGEVSNVIYDGNKMLWSKKISNEENQYYLLDLEDGKKEELYTVNINEAGIDIRGESGEYLVMAKNTMGGIIRFGVVKKEDFEKTIMKKMHMLPLM